MQRVQSYRLPTVIVGGSLLLLTGCQTSEQATVAPTLDSAGYRSLEVQVNAFTRSTQQGVALDVDASGGIAAVWDSRRQQNGQYGVYGRRLDPLGRPTTGEMRLNAFTYGSQTDPAIAIDPTGGAWAVWNSFRQDGEMGSIIARHFDRDFNPTTSEIIVNRTTTGDQHDPSVAVNARGEAFIAWTSPQEDSQRVLGRILSAEGETISDEFELGDGRDGRESLAVLGAMPDDSFLAVWAHADTAGIPTGIHGRTFNATGSATSAEFAVSEANDQQHIEPSLAVDDRGRFIVAWLTATVGDYAVAVRRFDESARPLGPARIVARADDANVGGWLSGAAIAMAPDGRFIVSYNHYGVDGDHQGILARRFDRSGAPVGEPITVNQHTAGLQMLQAAANTTRVVWSELDQIAFAWNGDAGLGDDSAAAITLLVPADLDVPEPAQKVFADAGTQIAPIPPTFDPRWERLPPIGLGPGDGPDFGFNGIDITGWTPPDPEVAVGPDHLVAMTNGAIAFFDKQGNLLFQDEIEDNFGFWGQQGATNFVFDPECLYDTHSGRFIAMACERGSNNRSYYLLAVSDDSNPVGAWHKYRIDVTNVDNDIDSPNMSVDDTVIYLSADFFGGDKYQVLMIEKAPLLVGGAINSDEFLFTGSGNQSMGIPINYDAGSANGYIIQSSEGTGNGISFSEVRIHALSNQLNNPQLTSIDITVPTYSYPNQPPQQGTSVRPFLFEPRFWSCAFRNGSLWAVHHVNSGRVRARWYQFDLQGWPDSANDPTLVQWGELDYGGGVHTFFPSIAVDADDNAMIVFARSSTSEFISMSRAFRRHDDPLNQFRPPEFVKKSTVPYTGSNRWGDYSGAEPDPAQTGVFWGFHEWTNSSNSWRTWFGKIDTNTGGEFVLADVEVVYGQLLSGDISDLTDSDNSYVSARSRIGPNAAQRNQMRMNVFFESTGNPPPTFNLIVESHVNQPGGTATVRLKNWSTGDLDVIGTHAVGQTDETVSFNDIPSADYINAGDGSIQLRIKHVVVATFTALGFDSFIDRAAIEEN